MKFGPYEVGMKKYFKEKKSIKFKLSFVERQKKKEMQGSVGSLLGIRSTSYKNMYQLIKFYNKYEKPIWKFVND